MDRLLPAFGIVALFGLLMMLSHAVFEQSRITKLLFDIGSRVAFFSLVGLTLTLFVTLFI